MYLIIQGQRLHHKVGRAWAITESLRELWDHATPQQAECFWKHWFWWAAHSRLNPVREVAALLKRHWPNIVTYFHHGITNAVSEGFKLENSDHQEDGLRVQE